MTIRGAKSEGQGRRSRKEEKKFGRWPIYTDNGSIRLESFLEVSSVRDLPRNFHFTRIIRQGVRERGCRGLLHSARFPLGANTLKAYPFAPA